MGSARDWEVEYREASEDRRHFTDLSWQLPSTIIVVNGILLTLAVQFLNCPIRGCVILFGAIFGAILLLNFMKFAYWSEKMRLVLRDIDSRKGFRRYYHTSKHPFYVEIRIRYFMFILLLSFILFLFYVGFTNL